MQCGSLWLTTTSIGTGVITPMGSLAHLPLGREAHVPQELVIPVDLEVAEAAVAEVVLGHEAAPPGALAVDVYPLLLPAWQLHLPLHANRIDLLYTYYNLVVV